MIYYIPASLVWFGLCAWKTANTTGKLRLRHYVFALPLILLVTLRGEVGTDTATYVQNAQDILWWGDRASSNEAGYELLVRGLSFFTSDPRVLVGLISLLAAVLFFAMLHLWEREQCILSLVLVPFCYFDFTMNGLRMGIAFPLAVIAILQFEKKRIGMFYLLAILSISVQMTAALLLLMLFLARFGIRLSSRGAAYVLVFGAFVLYPAYYFFGDRIAYKLLSYSVMSSPTSFSGTGPLILSLCACVLAVWMSQSQRYVGVIFLLIQLAFFRLSSFTYAGLRFQEMALFAQLLALSCRMLWPLQKRQLAAVALLGCLAFSWTARNFMATSGEPSAFLPYTFAWENR